MTSVQHGRAPDSDKSMYVTCVILASRAGNLIQNLTSCKPAEPDGALAAESLLMSCVCNSLLRNPTSEYSTNGDDREQLAPVQLVGSIWTQSWILPPGEGLTCFKPASCWLLANYCWTLLLVPALPLLLSVPLPMRVARLGGLLFRPVRFSQMMLPYTFFCELLLRPTFTSGMRSSIQALPVTSLWVRAAGNCSAFLSMLWPELTAEGLLTDVFAPVPLRGLLLLITGPLHCSYRWCGP